MVSLQPAPLQSSSSKKRKWEDSEASSPLIRRGRLPTKELKLWNDDLDDGGDASAAAAAAVSSHGACAASGIDLQLDSPLPPDWQRCLDIQSGKIHFYNTTTQKRTSRDPREIAGDDEGGQEPAPPPPAVISLDLELHLMIEASPSPRSRGSSGSGEEIKKRVLNHNSGGGTFYRDHQTHPSGGGGGSLCKTPPWVSLDADSAEMVATVCGRCHMLVMMCKSSPSCPNCKFLHPPDQVPPPSAMLKLGARALVL